MFPVLYRLMKEGNTIGYDDIVAMTQEEISNEDLTVETQEDSDPFVQFENWVMGLGEESAVTSEVEASNIGPDLSKCPASLSRVQREKQANVFSDDPWATPAVFTTDGEAPF